MPTPSRGSLAAITDPTARLVIQMLQDRLAVVEADLRTLQTTALKTGSPINAYGQRIEALADPQVATDAVNYQTMRRYVQIYTRAQQATPASPAPGIPGTPNTPPSNAEPLYDGLAIVQQVFADNPDFVERSCQNAPSGTWELMDAIVDALRVVDPRFGYNGKRGNPNDPSLDALAYDYAETPGGEGSTTVYIVDVIAGHCGTSPAPAWNDVTVFAPGVWISRGRF